MSFSDTVQLADALAWPVAVLIILLILRRPAIEILGRAKSVDVKGVKLELREKLEMARDSAEQAAMTVVFSARNAHNNAVESDSVTGDRLDAARQHLRDEEATVFAISPSSAQEGELVAHENPGLFLASIFDDLARDVRNVGKVIKGETLSYRDAVALLREREILTDNMGRVLASLHDARNIATHDDQQRITAAEAADWSGIAFGLRQRIDQRARMKLAPELTAKMDETQPDPQMS